MSACKLWKCSRCSAVVFIPTDGGITGGVCTQQRSGCKGEIEEASAEEAAAVRETMRAKGIAEQPWLTLVFAAEVRS